MNTSKLPSVDNSAPPTATPSSSTGGFKLKIKTSAPPTPALEDAPPHVEPLAPPPPKVKRAYNRKPKPEGSISSKAPKRAADTNIDPNPKRRISFKVGSASNHHDTDILETLTSAGPKLKLSRKQSTGPKNLIITAKKRPPPRPVGVGYDSEASDAEADPAIEQQFVLRMAPGPDCDYLRDAISNKTLGLKPDEGGADVSMKFLDRETRRAMVTVRGKMYAACMVDLPCIVEGMKSWDRRGWWKVADICQMLLVLGKCASEAEAKSFALPREVDRHSFAYAHGLTPPMHWVRKRRFRKRVSYREIENVEEEVEKLLREDAVVRRNGGNVEWRIIDQDAIRAAEEAQQRHDDEEDADAEFDDDDGGGYVETTENSFGQAVPQPLLDEEDDFDDTDLAAELEAGLAEDDGDADEAPPQNVTADAAASLGAVLSAQTPSSATRQQLDTPTAAATPASASSDEDEDDDDDDDDDDDPDSPDAIDEDLVEQQKEEDRKRQEVEDLVKAVELEKQALARQANPLLAKRTRQKIKQLEDELEMKRKAFGMEVDDDE